MEAETPKDALQAFLMQPGAGPVASVVFGRSNEIAITERGLNGAHRLFVSKDRKSTRLNSSHANISYAVFCLKKKKRQRQTTHSTPSSLRRSVGGPTTTRL